MDQRWIWDQVDREAQKTIEKEFLLVNTGQGFYSYYKCYGDHFIRDNPHKLTEFKLTVPRVTTHRNTSSDHVHDSQIKKALENKIKPT